MNRKVALSVSSVTRALLGGWFTPQASAAPTRIGHCGRPASTTLWIAMFVASIIPMTSCDSSKPPAPPKASIETLLADAKEGTVSAIDQIASRIRDGSISDAELTAAIDEALAARNCDSLGLRVAWGDVVDAALAAGKLDEARKKRCVAEPVSVSWLGNTERARDAGGANMPPSIMFMFQAAVGPSSTVSFNADIDSAQLDGSALKVGPKETAEPLARARNPAVPDTNIYVELPSAVAGKTLTVHWRVKFKDARTGAALADDWERSEPIAIPATGKGSFSGRSSRVPAPGGSK